MLGISGLTVRDLAVSRSISSSPQATRSGGGQLVAPRRSPSAGSGCSSSKVLANVGVPGQVPPSSRLATSLQGREVRISKSPKGVFDDLDRDMGRPADPRREQAVRTIRELTQTQGVAEGCQLAREKYADVPAGTWGRWRAEAVGSVREQSKIDGDAVDALAAEVIAEIPPMTMLAASPAEAGAPAVRRALDFWRMLAELDEDAQLLREFAVTTGPDGKRKVRVPFALRDAHRMRCDLVRLALQHAETVMASDQQNRLNQTVIEEIAKESPEVAQRIIRRLRAMVDRGRETAALGAP